MKYGREIKTNLIWMGVNMNKDYNFSSGDSPLIISMPHAGTTIPEEIASLMTPAALEMPDVDWHIPQLYDMARDYDATVLSAEYMRYVIDLNRSPDDTSLYPGQDTTGLCPVDTFSKQPVYKPGMQPDEAEIKARIQRYWQPYHEKLRSEIKRIHAIHGIAVLWDAHSIASHVPRFFNGRLPDFNFGTADRQSCATSLEDAFAETLEKSGHAKKFSSVFNGRFKGGYITRHYGMPAVNIHSVQLELSQCIYMEEKMPYRYDPELAKDVKLLIGDLLQASIAWASRHKQGL